MASVKIIFYSHKVNSDGTSPVIIQVIDGNLTKRKTIANVLEEQWDSKEKRVKAKKHDNYASINKNISDEFNRVENILLAGDFNINSIFEKKTKHLPDKDKPISLIEYIERMIAATKSGKRVKPKTGSRYAKDTVKHYNSAFGLIKRFAEHKGYKELRFQDITLNFYYDFKDYAFNAEHLTDNYFGAAIKFLKTCMAEAEEEKLHKSTDYKTKRFSKTSGEVDNVYLDENKLEILAKLDLSTKPKLERVRDLFLVGCWTGLRFSDFTNIKPHNIKDDLIRIKVQKTGESVVIPIHATVKQIMDRYKGKTANSLPPSISNPKMNEYIKDVCKEAKFFEPVGLAKYRAGISVSITKPLFELVSTHTARRAFSSNMFKMGVPTIVIMAITGHRTERAFMKYIKVTSSEKAEIMREIWNRKTMKAVI